MQFFSITTFLVRPSGWISALRRFLGVGLAFALGFALSATTFGATRYDSPPASQEGQLIRIGFWNLRSLSHTSRTHPDLKQMALTIQDLDCVALGEVYDDLVLGRLVNELAVLGGQWNKVKSPKRVGARLFTGERYGIIYRSDKLEVVHAALFREKYLYVRGVPYRHPFDRQPFISQFRTLDGRLEFALMVVNITEGPDVSLGSGRISVRAEAVRDAEVGGVKSYVEDFLGPNAAPGGLIVCGNFRRNHFDGSPAGLLGLPGMIDATPPEIPTVLGSTNAYDHILLQTNRVSAYSGEHGVKKFDEVLFGGDVNRAQRACSEHRPVWINLRVPKK